MTIQKMMFGNLQYQLAEGAACNTWLSAWLLNHQDDLREGTGDCDSGWGEQDG